jgi:Arylsulfotransferase (ASST)
MQKLIAAALSFIVLAAASTLQAQAPPGANESPARPTPKLGVLVNEPSASQGYTLVAPLQSTKTYLIDMQGRVVRKWESRYTAGQDAYLLENGHLLRAANLGENEAFFAGASQGGRIQEFTWDGELIWDYKFHNEKQIRHHSITRLPNGNVLMNVWERKTPAEFIAAGSKPEVAGTSDVLADAIYEVQPSGKTGGKIVWEWHLWDHLIQDIDSTKRSFGDVAAHAELVDVNFARSAGPAFANLARFAGPPPNQAEPKKDEPKKPGAKNDPLDRLKGIGYVGAAGGIKFAGFLPDWIHGNSVAYNAKLDQVMLSAREFSEVWIIDHSTTKAEAASHKGGRSDSGGDLLYRWGNPQAYRAGTAKDQRLFNQHDAHWIPAGLPGEGHLLVFSNGGRRPDGNYSTVDEVVTPVNGDGQYELKPGTAFGPDAAVWSYSAPNKSEFFAPFMAGSQRLTNGDTLISTGFGGVIFEVTPEKKIVWRYINPAKATGGVGVPQPGGGGPGGFARFTPPPPNPHSIQLLPGFLSFVLQLTAEQKKQVDDFETDASAKFEKSLSDEQRKQLKDVQKSAGPFGPGGPGGPPEFNRVLSKSIRDKLKLSTDQEQQVSELQKQAEAKRDAILKEEQKLQLKGMQDMMTAFAGAPAGAGPRGPGFGPPGGGPGGFMGFGGGGIFSGGSSIFRAYRYGPTYAGLAGRDLTPGKAIEELEAKPKEEKK